jgi:tetratricopeptide (TPR) repeat protein
MRIAGSGGAIALLAVAVLALGLTLAPAAGAGPLSFDFDPKQSPLPRVLHAQVVEVLDHLYGFEFEDAVERAGAIRAADHRHPLGDFLLAECYWWQAINNRDRRELVTRFRNHAEAAVAGSEKRLEEDDHDALALFFLGSALGRVAILDGLEGRRFESVNNSVKARKYLKLLNRHHPEIQDAYCGLGIYDYFAAQLPWFARILSKLLLGLGGDRERGIAELERAAHSGLFTKVEARLFLAIAYLDTEGRYEDAIRILEELHTRYPDNLDYYGMLAYAYRTRNDYASAIRMLENLVERGEREPAFGLQSRQMSTYFLASTYKAAGLYEQALPALDRLVAEPDSRAEWLAASSLLERGRIHDLLGARSAALADYRRVLDLKDFRGSKDKAKSLIAKPYTVSEEERAHHLGTSPAKGAPPVGGSAPARGVGGAKPGNTAGDRNLTDNDAQGGRATP